MEQSLQFKTDNDNLEEYRLGQHVAPDNALRPGERYPGITWRHCGPCASDWSHAASRAWFQALADGVREGKFEVRDKKLGSTVTADELASRADAAGRVFQVSLSETGGIVGASFENPVEILWSGEARDPLSPTRFQAQFALNDVVDLKLKAAGWEHGRDEAREDVTVYLDEDSRIQVHIP